MIVCALILKDPVTAVGIFMVLPRPNWTVNSLNRSINLSAFSTFTLIRLHPGSGLVTIYHWYLAFFVFRFIDLVFYGLIV